MTRSFAALPLLVVSGLACAQTIAPAFFQNGSNVGVGSVARGVSHDGAVVVGEFNGSKSIVSYSTSAGGVLFFPSCNNADSVLYAVNPAGTFAAGSSNFGAGPQRGAFWIWPNSCLSQASLPQGYVRSVSYGVSYGTEHVGQAENAAVKWTNGHSPALLPTPPGTVDSFATATSADGSVIVGGYRTWSDFTFIYHALRWTNAGYTVLPLPPNAVHCLPRALSASGDVMVGEMSGGSLVPHAFRWTQQTGMVSLGLLPLANAATDNSVAGAVSPEGSVVLGRGTRNGLPVAFIWRSDFGMMPLHDFLTAIGVDMSDWPELHEVNAVGGHGGQTICGAGRYASVPGTAYGFVVRGLPRLCGPIIHDLTPSHGECLGGSTSLIVDSWNQTSPQFQWYQRFEFGSGYFYVPMTDGGPISGSTTNTLSFSGLTTQHGGDYVCRITSGCDTVQSAAVSLTVHTPPVITQQPPLSLLPCGHGPETVAVYSTSTIGPGTYQWQAEVPFMSNNWVNLADGLFPGIATVSGANGHILTLTDFYFGGHTAYRCILTNPCGATTSWATLIVPCFADFDCNGSVDFFDYLDFIAAYNDDDPAADLNKDGNVDFFDYLDFVAFYSDGC